MTADNNLLEHNPPDKAAACMILLHGLGLPAMIYFLWQTNLAVCEWSARMRQFARSH